MDSIIKQREILFHHLHPDHNQAQSAMVMLMGIEGIAHISAPSHVRLQLHYDISKITLAIIEESLRDLGFHLDNSLLVKLKRALYYYTEETERANLGCRDSQHQSTRDVFIKQYACRDHGCRDPRPTHWRDYL